MLRRTFISAIASLRPIATGIGMCRRDTVRAEAERLYERCGRNLQTQEPVKEYYYPCPFKSSIYDLKPRKMQWRGALCKALMDLV